MWPSWRTRSRITGCCWPGCSTWNSRPVMGICRPSAYGSGGGSASGPDGVRLAAEPTARRTVCGSWPPHRLRAPGSATGAWDNAELASETQIIADRLVLDDLAVLEPDDVDLAGGDGLVGGAAPHELAGVPCVEGAVDDDGVALGDGLVDLEAWLGESPLQHPQGLDHALPPRRRAGRGVMG